MGAEGAKFTESGAVKARDLIMTLLRDGDTLVSGGCHLGGIDIWAEEIADLLRLPKIIHKPAVLRWHDGYMPRNLAIARDSEVVHNIVVNRLPEGFKGMRFPSCYHCHTTAHVKSGGCWTAKRAKKGVWHVIEQ